MANPRAMRRTGSMLKFSNASVTSARAAHARGAGAGNGPDNEESRRRRKFFNSSTEFLHIVSLIVMSLCRKVTNESHLYRRLAFYSVLILLGGFLHDFTPSFVNAFFFIFNLSSRHFLNQYFVKLCWAWNILVLIPLIVYTVHTFSALENVDLDQVEKQILLLIERRESNKQSSNSVGRGSVDWSGGVGGVGGPQNILHSQNNRAPQQQQPHHQQQFIEEYKARMQQFVEQEERIGSKSRIWRILTEFKNLISLIRCRAIVRVIVNFVIYYISVRIFESILLSTTKNLKATPTNAVSVTPAQDTLTPIFGFDVSGHVFVLVFANLIFIEECSVMINWEPLGDRLFDLSREFVSLEIESLTPIFIAGASWSMSATSRSLCRAWTRYNFNTNRVRIAFFLSTVLSLIWDFMLIQTALFYHSLMEKCIALIWAFVAWFVLYRVAFPALNFSVKQFRVQHE